MDNISSEEFNPAEQKNKIDYSTCQSLRHEPYILPVNSNEAIPYMTPRRFNEWQMEREAEEQEQLFNLIEKLRKEYNE
jgi:hypothetical protein